MRTDGNGKVYEISAMPERHDVTRRTNKDYSDCRQDMLLTRVQSQPAVLKRPSLLELRTFSSHEHLKPQKEAGSVFDGSPNALSPSETQATSHSKTKQKVKTALEDTSFFLGGLVKHPVESNSHYSILRHSTGLVFYQGPSTSIALTVFSDSPLDRSRRYWLQLKGWTGKTGMAAKSLFRNNNDWINVTPQQLSQVQDVPASDERAWQRDIGYFRTKATQQQRAHTERETAVIRIPYEATDGYFRVVLTSGDSKKILCPSPVFRVASLSADASSVKGASLKTLPIELGIKFAQTAAVRAATTAAGPVAATAKSKIMSSKPIKQYGGHVQKVWTASGAQGHIGKIEKQHNEQRLLRRQQSPSAFDSMSPLGFADAKDTGPKKPFPVQVSGNIQQGSGRSTEVYNLPTANLDGIWSDDFMQLAPGVYFGWAFVTCKDPEHSEEHQEWRHSIITITHASTQVSTVARQKGIRAYLIHDFTAPNCFHGARLDLIIMGYLRDPTPDHEQDVFLLETINDIAITQSTLSRPAWSYDRALDTIDDELSGRSLFDNLVDLRSVGGRQLSRIPTHVVGVRNDRFGALDRDLYGTGGYWIKRD